MKFCVWYWSIKPFRSPKRGQSNSDDPWRLFLSPDTEPRAAGQSPKHRWRWGGYALKCPSAHVPTFDYHILNAQHNLGLICPESSLALDCPHLSSIPLISVLTDHPHRSLWSKLDFGPPPGCSWEGLEEGVCHGNSIFSVILVPHYPSTAAFKKLCLHLFQPVFFLSKLGKCGLCMPYGKSESLDQCKQLSRIVPCLRISICIKLLTHCFSMPAPLQDTLQSPWRVDANQPLELRSWNTAFSLCFIFLFLLHSILQKEANSRAAWAEEASFPIMGAPCRGGAVPGEWTPGSLALLGWGKDHRWRRELPWMTFPGRCVTTQPEQSVIWCSLLPPAPSLTLPPCLWAHPNARSTSGGSCYPRSWPHDTITTEKFSTDSFLAMKNSINKKRCLLQGAQSNPGATCFLKYGLKLYFLCSPSWKRNKVGQPALSWWGWLRDGDHPNFSKNWHCPSLCLHTAQGLYIGLLVSAYSELGSLAMPCRQGNFEQNLFKNLILCKCMLILKLTPIHGCCLSISILIPGRSRSNTQIRRLTLRDFPPLWFWFRWSSLELDSNYQFLSSFW